MYGNEPRAKVRIDVLGRTLAEDERASRWRAHQDGTGGARRAPEADRGPSGGGLAWVLVRIVVYLAALVPLVLLYGTKQRALVIAPPIGLIGAVATWFLLQDAITTSRRRIVHAVTVGIVLVELTWAFGYWTVAPVVGGAAIWLAFYVLSGVAEHSASNRLDRRTALEYGVVAIVGVVVVLASAPWYP